MEDPLKEIKEVVYQLTATESPDVQRAAVYKYYVPNAGFRHPLSYVDSGVLSRESILGIYQWYRVLSPHVHVHVSNVVYDARHNVLLLDIAQEFRLFFLPVKSVPSRLLVRLTLEENNGLHRIKMQEDFFHPDDVTALIFPPVLPFVRFTLRTFGTVSNICAKTSQVLGYWRPSTTGLAREADEAKKTKKPPAANGRTSEKHPGPDAVGNEKSAKKKNGKNRTYGNEDTHQRS